MQNRKLPELNTPGKVAQQLGVPVHRVQYVLRSRPHLRPAATAGRLRLFDDETIELIKAELETIDSKGAPSNG
jgi:DNA-binding transcriptional MerR regulator